MVSVTISFSSDVIVDVNVKSPELELTKILSKNTVDKLPEKVKRFPSSGLIAIILTPPLIRFSRVNVPKIAPVNWSIAFTIISFAEIIELTIKSALNVLSPRIIFAVPILSPTESDESIKYPPSEINIAVSISTSFESWLTVIVKSAIAPQFKSDNVTVTSGEKSVQSNIIGKIWTSTSPSSEVIVDVNVKNPLSGLSNILTKVIFEIFPFV